MLSPLSTPVFANPHWGWTGDYTWFFGVLALQGLVYLYVVLRYGRGA